MSVAEMASMMANGRGQGTRPSSRDLSALAHAAPWLMLRVGLPLALSVAVYIGRSEHPEVIDALPASLVLPAHSIVGSVMKLAPKVVMASFPDAAWAYALGSMMTFIWRGSVERTRTAWLVAGAALAVGYELAQLVRLVPGTFDLIDLFVSAAAYAAATLSFQGGSRK